MIDNSAEISKKDDNELVAEALADRSAFLHIIKRYEKPLSFYIRRLTNVDDDEIEDILQEVFIKVYLNLNDFNSELKFSSWIYRIAHNHVISRYRKIKARPEGYALSIDEEAFKNLAAGIDLEISTDASLTRDSIGRVLSALDSKYREILILKFLEEKNYQEISDIIKKPAGTVASDLFTGGVDPIGETITVGSKKMEVVGVLKKLGSRIGMISVDESVIVPATTAEKSLLGDRGQVMINVLINDLDKVGTATTTISSVLRSAHNLKIDSEDDFRIMDAGSMVSAAQESAKTMSALLTAIAAITLLVSGIGIMNVMFVTVAERTKEIGIAKAIGAKQSDILLQFLLESVILSTLGGLIGILIGQASIPILSHFNIISLASSLNGPILGFSFAVVVGVFFGFYPAFKASRLDPVDSLRSE